MNYEYEKYVCTKETLRQTIDQYGVAIIPSILDETECAQMVNGIWDFFEHISSEWPVPINRNLPDTWQEFYRLYPSHSMLVQYFGVGHAQASWDVRQNPKIVEIFAHFWGCTVEDLLVSFDGLSFNLPPEITQRGWNKGNTWYHTDQSYTRPDFGCIQSFVTGIDINDYDATLSILEGSNRYHGEFRDRYNIINKKDWYKLNIEQEAFYKNNGCHRADIKCPKGSLVFWDSRTIHCGIEASRQRAEPNLRAVVYLCYMPRVLCNPANLKKKQKAFSELRATTHYPCTIKLFGKGPNTYGNTLPTVVPIEAPVLTDLGKRLAGF